MCQKNKDLLKEIRKHDKLLIEFLAHDKALTNLKKLLRIK